jgi:hypothetical protein
MNYKYNEKEIEVHPAGNLFSVVVDVINPGSLK